jgi:hypothetical protein
MYANEAAAALGWQLEMLSAGTDREIDEVFASLSEKRIGALGPRFDQMVTNPR